MAGGKGWVSIWRSIQDSFLWDDKPFSKGQAWIDLILMANHEDVEGLRDGKVVTFKRGTVSTSIVYLSDRWKWDRKKTRSFLKILESQKMATTESTKRGTTITIVNYDVYQNQGTTDGTSEGTTLPQLKDNSSPHNNNENNDNNISHTVMRPRGEYNNVFLSDEDVMKLQNEFPDEWERKVENMSKYMKTSGRSYKNHYEKIREWIMKDKKEGYHNNQSIRKGGEQNGEDRGQSFNVNEWL